MISGVGMRGGKRRIWLFEGVDMLVTEGMSLGIFFDRRFLYIWSSSRSGVGIVLFKEFRGMQVFVVHP